nr:hypothetical protein [Cyclobacteriaceae bacterium]
MNTPAVSWPMWTWILSMKAISPKRPVHPLHRYAEEKPLGNRTTILLLKAGLITCLFLWLSTPLSAQHTSRWLHEPVYRDAYNNCLQLKTETARNLLRGRTDPEAYALLSLSDALELMITEDPAKFSRFEPEHQRRLEALKKIAPATEKSLIALAEIRLQWAFVYLKFG